MGNDDPSPRINDGALDEKTYYEYLEVVERRVTQNFGKPPTCPMCHVYDRHKQMNVRQSIIGLQQHADGEAHEDVTMKCPQCQFHAHFGYHIDYEEAKESVEMIGGTHFDAAHDLDDESSAVERLEHLGYL